MSLDVSCDSTCDFSWWIHPLDVFYSYFPKVYMWEAAEEMETRALGTLRGLCSSRIHPGMVCSAPFPLQRSRVCSGVWSGTRVLYNQSIPCSWAELWLGGFSTCSCLCRFLMEISCVSSVFLSTWKTVLSKICLTRWRKDVGFSSTSVTWNMFSTTSLFCWLFEMKVICSREGGVVSLQFSCSKTWDSWKFRIWIKYYCLASAFYILQGSK